MTTPRLNAMNQPFLTHLNVRKTPHVLLTAETEDFDETLVAAWKAEGFETHYVPLDAGGQGYVKRMKAVSDEVVGLSDQYAIVAYGEAANVCLEAYIKSSPRLCAIIAYYPSRIPEPSSTKYAMHTSVLVHLCGPSISVSRFPEVLGIQSNKRKTVRKTMDSGVGLGGLMSLSYKAYKYEGVEEGFAESDLDEYDGNAEALAWSRSLEVLKRAFGVGMDIEKLRDEHYENTKKGNISKILDKTSSTPTILHVPTLTGGTTPQDLSDFYTEFFSPSPASLTSKLVSRTIGTDRIVDEFLLTFNHNKVIPWMLPNIPPTNRRVEVVVVAIVNVKGGVVKKEHVYWDQASVLMQVGLLDPKVVPEGMREKGVKKLPVVGAEGARAVVRGDSRFVNESIDEW